MKGERIYAELLSILGLLLYGVMLQHLYAELMHEPDRSWINRAKAWWVTRGSRKLEKDAKQAWLTIVKEPPTAGPAPQADG